MVRVWQEFLGILANLEASLSSPNSPLRLRRLQLRAHGIKAIGRLWVGRAFIIYNKGRLSLGDRCAMGDHTLLINHTRIEIGADFLAASGLAVHSGSHDPQTLIPIPGPVVIGDRVWCGANVTIIGPVVIGDDVVIGAGSVVVRDLPSNCVAAGMPAKPVRELGRNPQQQIWTAFKH